MNSDKGLILVLAAQVSIVIIFLKCSYIVSHMEFATLTIKQYNLIFMYLNSLFHKMPTQLVFEIISLR